MIPAPRPGRRDHPGSRVRHLQIDDPTAVRRIGLAWGADRRLLPAAELFRRHVIETDLGPYRVGGDQPGA